MRLNVRLLLLIFTLLASLNGFSQSKQTAFHKVSGSLDVDLYHPTLISSLPSHLYQIILDEFQESIVEVETNEDLSTTPFLFCSLDTDFTTVLFLQSRIFTFLFLMLILQFIYWKSSIRWFVQFAVFRI